jgi:hypothetical protein
MGADAYADVFYLSVYPDVRWPEAFDPLDRQNALLSGGLANGAYTLAWILLLFRAPWPRWYRAFSIPGVAGGLGLALSGFTNWTPGLIGGTAVAIPAFTIWTVLVGQFYWKKRREAATMSPHV